MRGHGQVVDVSGTRRWWRAAVWPAALGMVASALQATTASGAAVTATEAPEAESAGSSSVVTLVTGDRVDVREADGGRTVASLLPGSPSYGKPVQTMHTGRATYVIPRLSPAARDKLDYSMFDVTALAEAERDGSVPVTVRFRDGAHDVDGLDVEQSTAHRQGSDVVVDASYDAEQAGADTGSWSGVESVRLAGAPDRSPAARDDYEMHTLTIKARSGGKPVRYADAAVLNVDDGRLFNFPVYVDHGIGKVSVPEGHYSVQTWIGRSLVTTPNVTVRDDTSTTVRASDAKVQPKISVRKARIVEPEVGVIRTAEKYGSFGLSISGVLPRLNRVPATLRHGKLTTLVAAAAVPRKRPKSGMYFAKEHRSGTPADLSFTYRRGQFASVPQRLYSTGSPGGAGSYAYGFAPGETFGWMTVFPARMPSRRTVWLSPGRGLRWLVGASVARYKPYREADMYVIGKRYKRGRAAPLNFFRGPVGPGKERGIDGSRTGRNCNTLCRDGNRLRGRLPLLSSAGSGHFADFWANGMGSWKLRHKRKSLQRGGFLIAPNVDLPAQKRRYTLEATSHPGLGKLSSRVSDSWGFSSGRGEGVVPLLMPSYVPPTGVDGRIKRLKSHYRLNFENLGPKAARVTKASLRWSVNGGRTWRRAGLKRLDRNSFRVRYRNPPAKGQRRYVSLRVTAKDAGGRTVEETALRAYRLRKASNPGDVVDDGRVADRGLAGDARPACKTSGKRAYRCFALVERSGDSALTRTGDPAGWGANELRDAYGLPDEPEPGQKVAVVVAYDYPTAAADMNRYRRQYGLPLCKIKGGCFAKINQEGERKDFPRPDPGWAMEAALDLQMISAACPTCKIVLAEAKQPTDRSLGKAIDAAIDAGAVVTNHSYGGGEYGGIERANRKYAQEGVTAVAASGDSGFTPASFPASSPDVVSVGGTVLHHSTKPRGWRENAWAYGGSGCSAYFTGPEGQDDKACDNRTIADVSAVADGVAVYNSFSGRGKRTWWTVGGTSVSSPLVAGMIAAAGRGGMKPGDVYADSDGFHDIRRGRNGFCKGSYLCTAKPGYDGPTGFGTPEGLEAFATD